MLAEGMQVFPGLVKLLTKEGGSSNWDKETVNNSSYQQLAALCFSSS